MTRLVASFLTFGLLTSNNSYAGSTEDIKDKLIGKWEFSRTIPISETSNETTMYGTANMTCNQQFFPTETVTTKCKMGFSALAEAGKGALLKLDFDVSYKETGEWSIHKDKLYIKTVDSKVDVTTTKINVNGEDHSKSPKMDGFKAKMQRSFEKMLLKGETDEATILLVDDKKFVFQETIAKEPTTITALKK